MTNKYSLIEKTLRKLNFTKQGFFALSLAFIFTALIPSISNSKDWQINLEEVDFSSFVKKVSQITGETYVVDPEIRKKVTVASNDMVDEQTVRQILRSVLEVNDFVLINVGGVKVISSNKGRKRPSTLFDGGDMVEDTMITKAIFLDNVNVNDVINAVGVIISDSGRVQPSQNTNSLIVTDFPENIKKVSRLVEKISNENRVSMTSISLNYAWADNLERLLKDAFANEVNRSGPAALKILTDSSNNSLILRGPEKVLAEARSFIKSADKPKSGRISTKVIYLKHTQAEKIAPMLSSFLSSNYGNGRGSNITQIQAEPSINALIIRAEPRTMNDIEDVIRKLDIRKTQVHIEAAIVEVTGDLMDKLGFQYGAGDTAIGNLGFGLTSFTNSGQTLLNLLQNVSGDNSFSGDSGLSAGFSDNKVFSVLLQALSTSSEANLLSTPSITTVNNEEARILVGQNVPFITGTFTNDGGDTNPFTTIERRDVGITLRVVPRIYHGNVVRLEVEQEVSSVQDASLGQDAADIITNTRSISTNVIASNGEIVVLGGLIQDDISNAESKVPLLGDIPGLGYLFSSTSETKVKRNLLVFLRPTIIKDDWQSKTLAERRYELFESSKINSLKPYDSEVKNYSINQVFGNNDYIAKDFNKNTQKQPTTPAFYKQNLNENYQRKVNYNLNNNYNKNAYRESVDQRIPKSMRSSYPKKLNNKARNRINNLLSW